VTRGAQPGASHGVPLADLADLAGLGAYFAVASHDPRSAIAAPWLPLDELTGSARVLRDRIAAVRSALGAAAGCGPQEVEFRVAASVTQLGIAARLICPALGLAVLAGAVPHVAAARWQPALGGAFPLSLPAGRAQRPGTGRDDAGALAAGLGEQVIEGPVASVTGTVASMSVSPAVLWGNVASAVNGAASMIAIARPGLAGRAQALSAALLRRPPLAGTCDGAPGAGFRRRSCCLIYRASSGSAPAFCGDCILLGPGAASAGAGSAGAAG
jgi:hypothetical protein